MSCGHRLTALQMCVSGHDRRRIDLGAVDQRELQFAQRDGERVDLRTAIQPRVGRHLIVAGTSRVQFRTRGADATGQLGLDVHVDVLQRRFEFEATVLDVLANIEQTAFDC